MVVVCVSLGSRLLPMAMPLAKKAIAPIATGALSGLASLGVDKIFGKGAQQGGFFIPQDKIAQLIAYKHLLSAGQKKVKSGGQLVIKPTRTQQGGFLATLLTSMGVPLLLNALTGKGSKPTEPAPLIQCQYMFLMIRLMAME